MPFDRRHPTPIGTILPGEDPKITVRIIGRCNFRCPSCSSFSGPRRRGLISLSDFRCVLDVLAENGYRGVLNISGGETTLHPELPFLTRLASRRLPGAHIIVFTNGDWVGRRGWRRRLASLLAGPNVLIRFSLDRQHAEGKARAFFGRAWKRRVASLEKERLEKARAFMTACLEKKAKPAKHFDFAYKGSLRQARQYTVALGDAPLYPIIFRRNPSRRPKKLGYMAVDLNAAGRPRVYLTLGHIPGGEALGGLESLPSALARNRAALKAQGSPGR